jgi:hypothetical protein
VSEGRKEGRKDDNDRQQQKQQPAKQNTYLVFRGMRVSLVSLLNTRTTEAVPMCTMDDNGGEVICTPGCSFFLSAAGGG